MSDTELKIEITVDIGSVEPAITQVKSAIEGLGGSKSAIEGLGAAVEGAKAHFASMGAETEGWSSKLMSSAGGALSQITELAGGAGAIAGAAISAGQKVYEFAESIAKTAEENKHLAQSSGLSTGRIQELRAVSTMTGTSVDTLAKGVGQLSTSALTAAAGNSTSAAALKKLGVSANDGKTDLQRFFTIADGFKKLPDDTQRAALATQIFGQSGKDLLPILSQGSAGLNDMMSKAQDYGVADTAVAQSAQANGEALADSLHEGELGWQGLTNVAADAFGPVLKEVIDDINSLIKAFIQSYTEGGVVAVIVQVLKTVFTEVVTVIESVAAIFGALWDAVSEVVSSIVDAVTGAFGAKLPNMFGNSDTALNIFKDVFTIVTQTVVGLIDVIVGTVRQVIDWLGLFAKVANDALTLNWGKIGSDWKSGMDKITSDAEADAKRVGDAWRKAAEAANDIRNGGKGAPPPAKPGKSGGGQGDSSDGKSKHHGGAGGGGGSGHGGGHAGGAGRRGSSGSPAGAATQSHDDDAGTKALEQELDKRKAAYQAEQAAQKTFLDFSKQQELDYWNEVVKRTNISENQRNAAKQKAAELSVQIVKEEHEQQIQIDEDKAQTALRLKQGQIQSDEDAAKFRVQMGQETEEQLLAQEKDFEKQRYDAERADLQRRAELQKNNKVEYQKILDQIVLLAQQHQQKLNQLEQQGVLQRTQSERQAINSIASSWSQAIGKMLTLQSSFASTLKSMWQSVQQAVASMISSTVQKWITSEHTKNAATGAGTAERTAMEQTAATQSIATSAFSALKQIAHQAAVAAAGAYSAIARIPVVGPVLAPAAAAAALIAVYKLGQSVFSAEDGAGDVPFDNAPFLLHRNEMVLPANIAAPLRSMIAGGGAPANSNAPAPANDGGGDAHLHLHGDIIHNPAQLEAWFKRNAPAIGAGVRQYVRQGGTTGR
jgi:phage-related protein